MSYHNLSCKYFEAVGRLTEIRDGWQLNPDFGNFVATVDSMLKTYSCEPARRPHLNWSGLVKVCRILQHLEERLVEGVVDADIPSELNMLWWMLADSIAWSNEGLLLSSIYDLQSIFFTSGVEISLLSVHARADWLVSRLEVLGVVQLRLNLSKKQENAETGC
jgi:hypothetical protein